MAQLHNKLRAKFFKDDVINRDMVEISIIGDPNTLIQKVDPDHVRQFPREWESYKLGEAEVKVHGIPLTDVPGVDRDAALALKLKGVRVAEELAGLDEAAAKALGMGGLTFWKAAKNLVKLREFEAMSEAPKRSRKAEAEAQIGA